MRDPHVAVPATPLTGADPAPATGVAPLCWPELELTRDRVVELAVPAQCWTAEGDLWEFDGVGFGVTRLRAHGVREAADPAEAPAAGWTHPAGCACPACRVGGGQ